MLTRTAREIRRQRHADPKDHADRAMEHHIVRESPVRSFRLQAAKPETFSKTTIETDGPVIRGHHVEGACFPRSSSYAFTLTWTPGHVTVAGDIGELTITHYHALADFEEGLRWLTHCTVGDYLITKVHGLQRTHFDKEGTLAYIRERLMEEPLAAAKANRRERAAWFKEDPEDRDEEMPGSIFEDRYDDAWERWQDLEKALCKVDDFYLEGMNDWSTADGRRHMLDDIESFLESVTPEERADFIAYDLGFGDWYGDYDYPHQAYFQLYCMQQGARMILGALK